MSTTSRLLAIAAAALMLSGCAYKPLKAPCSADEGGVPMAYSELKTKPSIEPFDSLDRCGPMRPI